MYIKHIFIGIDMYVCIYLEETHTLTKAVISMYVRPHVWMYEYVRVLDGVCSARNTFKYLKIYD